MAPKNAKVDPSLEEKQARTIARGADARDARIERRLLAVARALEALPLARERAWRIANLTVRAVAFFSLAERCRLAERGRMNDIALGPTMLTALSDTLRGGGVRFRTAWLVEAADALCEVNLVGSQGERAPALRIDAALRALLSEGAPEDPRGAPLDAPDWLGQLYERSLTRPLAGAQASGAASKSVPRKEAGIFYTPPDVVAYILERTLDRVLADKTPADAQSVRVLDPACGSGAFLLGAYRALLAWHLRWHVEHDPERATQGENARVVRTASGAYRLRLHARIAILRACIFGVDLDAEAVDVARLSLLLTCFDGDDDSVESALLRDEAIPSLTANLQSGDSLGPEEPSLAPDGRKAKGRDAEPPRAPTADTTGRETFAWRTAFAEVFAERGFDVVIGNPPYISFGGRHAVDISSELRRYYADNYESGGWPTAHSLFLERSVKLLSRRYVSFVVPDQVGHLAGYRSARAIAEREAGVVEVRYWGERVFPGVTTPAMTFVLDKEHRGVTTIVDRDGSEQSGLLRQGDPWTFSPAAKLIERLREGSFSLGKLVGDCGIRTTSSKKQVVPLAGAQGSFVPVLEGKLIERYACRPPELAVRLDSDEPLFVSREERYRDVAFVIRQTAAYPIVGPREHALYFRNSLLALYAPRDGLDVRYVVALLNSKLLRFVYTETVREANQRVFPQVKVKALQSLPLRTVDRANPEDRERHDQLVELVEETLAAQKDARASDLAQMEGARERFRVLDARIDDLVYELYELTAEERAAVEQSVITSARAK